MKGGEEIGEDVMVTNFSVSSSESVKKKKKKRDAVKVTFHFL